MIASNFLKTGQSGFVSNIQFWINFLNFQGEDEPLNVISLICFE